MSRNIRETTKYILWGKSAGRCQKCATPVYIHPSTGSIGVFAELAHNLPFSDNGPRKQYKIKTINKTKDINDIDNLLLLCPSCHKEVDKTRKDEFSPEKLKKIKYDFEKFIFNNTNLLINKKTYCITYFPNLRNKAINISIPNLIEGKYILDNIDLAMTNYDSMIINWEIEKKNLEISFCKKVIPILEDKYNLSIFALGPIPLLMYFGYMLSNTQGIDVYQLQKHNQTWLWQENGEDIEYFVSKNKKINCVDVILILSLSGKVSEERIIKVFPNMYSHSVYKIEVKNSGDDFLKTEKQRNDFFLKYSCLKEEIANEHRNSKLHIFGAIPVSIAVGIGMHKNDSFDLTIVTYNLANDEYEKVFEF